MLKENVTLINLLRINGDHRLLSVCCETGEYSRSVGASIHHQIWRKTREESFKNGYEAADERIPLLTKNEE